MPHPLTVGRHGARQSGGFWRGPLAFEPGFPIPRPGIRTCTGGSLGFAIRLRMRQREYARRAFGCGDDGRDLRHDDGGRHPWRREHPLLADHAGVCAGRGRSASSPSALLFNVGHILSKLALRDGVQIVVSRYETGFSRRRTTEERGTGLGDSFVS